MEYSKISSKALKLMRLTCAIRLLFLLAGAAAAGILLSQVSALAASAVPAAALLFCALWLAIAPCVRFKRYKYLIAPDRIEIIEGLIFIQRTIVPIDRIHQIDLRSGPLDRMTGLAKVCVITAGSQAKFAFLEPEKAEEIALYLNQTVSARIRADRTGDDGDV